MANRNNRQPMGNRRMDFGRVDRSKGYGRPMPVSPWQAGGPSASLGNILPLAANSQATLALANNLINNLLQSRQNVVPSLLDMPIRRDFGADMNRGFDRGYNRMGNQSNFRRPTGNYVRPADRPNYRKPFRPNDGPKNKPNQSQKKDTAESKAKPVKVESADSEAKEVQVKEESKDDGAKVEVKTEGKEEGNGDAGASDAASAAATPATGEGEKKEGPKTAYDAVNPALLHCHICNKMMWDGRSFENHLNGRAHYIMMQKTSEGYALTADTMRQELKIREMKHFRKLGQPGPRNFFCAMCDTYAADGSAHRTTVGHRKLKKYLHPACTFCHREMATRIELDEHRLSAEHLLSVQGRRKEFTVKPKPEVMMISTLSTEEGYVRYDRENGVGNRRQPRGAAAKAEPKKKDGEGSAGEGAEAAEGATDGAGEADAEMAEPEEALLDVKEGDDLSAITKEMIPAYKPERGVGRSFLSDFTCVHCKLCRKLLDSQETAEVHLRTWRHHLLYVKHLQRGSKPEEDAAQQAAGGIKAKATDSGKRASGTDGSDDGNWKRRKTTIEEMEEDAADEDDRDENAEGDDGEGQDAEMQEGEEQEGEEQEGEEQDGDEQEKWEQDLDTLMTGVSEELETAIESVDAAKKDKPAAAEKPAAPEKPAVPEKSAAPEKSADAEQEEAEEASPAKAPQTPSRGRGARGRGRGRGVRARRS